MHKIIGYPGTFCEATSTKKHCSQLVRQRNPFLYEIFTSVPSHTYSLGPKYVLYLYIALCIIHIYIDCKKIFPVIYL